MKRYGLTGGIGVGKSVVAKLFSEEAGIPTLDADRIARALREPGGRAEAPILSRFGTTDRKTLRKLISTDPSAKKDLESILHPMIEEESRKEFEQIERNHPEAPFLLYEATLFIESGRKRDFDGTIVVTAPLPDRLSRITSRDGITKDEALGLIEAQSPDSYRIPLADHLIQNIGSMDDLRTQVRKVLELIRGA
jgi:dephospho-CoA kinase